MIDSRRRSLTRQDQASLGSALASGAKQSLAWGDLGGPWRVRKGLFYQPAAPARDESVKCFFAYKNHHRHIGSSLACVMPYPASKGDKKRRAGIRATRGMFSAQ